MLDALSKGRKAAHHYHQETIVTTLLCNEDAYLREFDATVMAVTEKGIVLDQTAFYPGGGGQPPDAGLLRAGADEYTVKKLSRASGQIVHEIEADGFPPKGATVHGVVDWERRYKLMRTHTALHILCGVVWRDYGALVTGGNMEPLTARMDFELESMSADFAREVERAINEEVAAERPVHVAVHPREEALTIPDLIRTKVNLIPSPCSRFAPSTSRDSTSRPTAGSTSITRGRSARSASSSTRARAASTSASASESNRPTPPGNRRWIKSRPSLYEPPDTRSQTCDIRKAVPATLC